MEYEMIQVMVCVGFLIFAAWLLLTLMVVTTVFALEEIGAYEYVKDYLKQLLRWKDEG